MEVEELVEGTDGYIITKSGHRVEAGDELIVETLEETIPAFTANREMKDHIGSAIVVHAFGYGTHRRDGVDVPVARTRKRTGGPGRYTWVLEDLALPESMRNTKSICKVKIRPI